MIRNIVDLIYHHMLLVLEQNLTLTMQSRNYYWQKLNLDWMPRSCLMQEQQKENHKSWMQC